MRPIAIFYHVLQKKSIHATKWEQIFCDQFNRLKDSMLYDAAKYVQINICGSETLPLSDNKLIVKHNAITDCEAETLTDLWLFANYNPDYAIFYFHTKGVSFLDSNDVNVLGNLTSWRKYMEYFNIDLWMNNVNLLDEYDCCGTELVEYACIGGREWTAPHYSGNFWWTNASYIKKLDPRYIHNREPNWWRWASEFWIGTENPKMYNYYTSPGKYGKDKYFDRVTKQEALMSIRNQRVNNNG